MPSSSLSSSTPFTPPPKLPLFKINLDSSSTPEITIEASFKASPSWGLVIQPTSRQCNNNGNNNNNTPISTSPHNQQEADHLTTLRQRVNEWRALCHTDANAAHNLGIALFRGEGTQKDIAASARMFSIAAKMGNINSAFNLGWLFTNGQNNGHGTQIKQSWRNAVYWWSFSAERGHSSAARNVGLLYALGIAVDQDGNTGVNWEKAVYYYQLACDLGNIKAHFALAQCYRDGTGVEVNLEKSNQLLQKAELLQKTELHQKSEQLDTF